jgi:hypothetical protein
MQGILVDVRGYTRIVVVCIYVVVAIVASVVGHQIRSKIKVIHVVQIETIQVTLVFTIVCTGVVIYDGVAVKSPVGIVHGVHPVKIVTRPVVLDDVVLEQVPSSSRIVNIHHVIWIAIPGTRLAPITVLNGIPCYVIIVTVIDIITIRLITTRISNCIINCVAGKIHNIVIIQIVIVSLIITNDVLLDVIVDHKGIGCATIIVNSIETIPVGYVVRGRTCACTLVWQIVNVVSAVNGRPICTVRVITVNTVKTR